MAALQRFRLLGNDGFPLLNVWVVNIHRYDATPRAGLIGLEEKALAVVAHEVVLRFESGQKLGRFAGLELALFTQRHPGDVVLAQGPLADENDQKLAVFSHDWPQAKLLVVRTLIDKNIVFLVRAETVVIEFLGIVDTLESLAFPRFVIAAVEKALAVLGPGGA